MAQQQIEDIHTSNQKKENSNSQIKDGEDKEDLYQDTSSFPPKRCDLQGRGATKSQVPAIPPSTIRNPRPR
jgi:hypothetical protein